MKSPGSSNSSQEEDNESKEEVPETKKDTQGDEETSTQIQVGFTTCPRSLYPFDIVSEYIKWTVTSWDIQ